MADALKYMYNPQFFGRLCPVIKEIIPQFNETVFINRIFDRHWPDLELKRRTRQITVALHSILPPEFPEAAEKIIAISNLLRKNREKQQSYPYIFLPDYIELYGQSDFEISMNAILEVTKLVSAEFAIRPFLLYETDRTLAQLTMWSNHSDENVRRLTSEGCRPRLPWASALPAFKKDPSPILPILENLKDDPSEYVRRSVANNLNDIAKDNPEVVLKTVRQWQGSSPSTQWIIKHGCRTLLKNGNDSALLLNGFDTKRKFELKKMKSGKKVRKGDSLSFSFTVVNLDEERARIRLEYGIDYLTATSKTSRKVFKIGEYLSNPGLPLSISRKQSFKDLSTRKHVPGVHHLRVLLNGQEMVKTKFLVIS